MKMRLFFSLGAVFLGTALQAQPPMLPASVTSETPTPVAVVSEQQLEIPAAEQTCDSGLGLHASVDYLLWWIKKGPVDAPLVTTGNPADAFPGAIGQPGTQVLFGDDRLGFGTFSGLRLNLGVTLIDNIGLEGSFFFLEQKSVQFRAQSGAAGSPLLAHPFLATELPLGGGAFGPPQELEEQVSNPTSPAFAGRTSISADTRLSGWDVNASLGGLTVGSGGPRVVLLAGFRALDLNENLQIMDQYTNLSTFTSGFLGQSIAAGSQFTVTDRFQTVNHFYGGQLGARGQYDMGIVSFGLQAKVALGATQQQVMIDGSSTVVGPLTATVPGGLYAQPSNMGEHYRSVFSVVPEGQATVGFHLTDNIQATIGYTFLYWSGVVRPGNQIDRVITPGQVPTDPGYGQVSNTALRPVQSFKEDGFWAQGINFGLQIAF